MRVRVTAIGLCASAAGAAQACRSKAFQTDGGPGGEGGEFVARVDLGPAMGNVRSVLQ